MSVHSRTTAVDNHNVKNILEHLEDDPGNKALIQRGVSSSVDKKFSNFRRNSIDGLDGPQEDIILAEDLKIEHCNLLHIKDVKIMTVLRHKEACLALLANAVGMYNISFFTPFLAVELKTYNLSDSQIGFCFMLASVPYLIAIVVTGLMCKKVPRKIQFIISFFVSAFAFALLGPSHLFFLPHKLPVLLSGLTVIGFIQALVFIPCLPEAIDTF